MKAIASLRSYALAVPIWGAGVVLAWLLHAPAAMIAAVAVILFWCGKIPAFLSAGASCLMFIALPLLPAPEFGAAWSVYLPFVGFALSAIAVAMLFTPRRTPAPADRMAREAQLIVENMPGLGWSTDPSGNFVYVNQSVLDYVGKSTQELDRIEGTDEFGWRDAVHPDDVDAIIAIWLRCLQTGEPYECEHRVRRVDGTYRWFRNVARPARDHTGRITGWYGTTIDIDDQKRSEEDLRQSERRLQLILDTMPALVWCTDAAGHFSYFSNRTLDYLGLSREELSRDPYALVHPDDIAGFKDAWTRSLETGHWFSFVYRLRRKDGVYRWHEGRGEPFRDGTGRVIQWYGISVDIHDRQAAEEALRSSERQLRLLIEAIPAFIWSVSPTGMPTYQSKQNLDYLGIRPDEVPSFREKCVHPDDYHALSSAWTQAVNTGTPFSITLRLRRADGEYRWHEARAEPFRDQDGAVRQWYGASVEVDERIRAEQALRATEAKFQRATQLASLAEMSASIAHEVSQPLTAIVSHSHACQRWLAASPANIDRARMNTEQIIRDANAAADVVKRVRALFKRSALVRTRVNLNEVITEARHMLVDEITTKNIVVDADLDATLPPAMVDRVQMQQVLVNLLRNAIDAMAATTQKLLTIKSQRDGPDKVLVEIGDRGVGIDDYDKIFEPFFTTKHSGMGMGLSICRSIVEAHHGRLGVAKNEPQGAVFTLVLPVELGAGT